MKEHPESFISLSSLSSRNPRHEIQHVSRRDRSVQGRKVYQKHQKSQHKFSLEVQQRTSDNQRKSHNSQFRSRILNNRPESLDAQTKLMMIRQKVDQIQRRMVQSLEDPGSQQERVGAGYPFE